MSLNPLSTILSSNKLEGDNYVDWKRNLDIVLTVDKHKWVLTTPCPQTNDDSTQEEKDVLAAWLRSDEIARCYILASMNNVLQQQHRDYETATDMLYNLHEMFGGQGRQARQQAVRQFMNCRMKAGTPVRDHMMLIISYLNEMEILGSEIDGETKIDMILETLPETFDTFKLNYSMNKLEYTVTELMKELQTAEALTKKKRAQGEVHATASTSGSKKRPRNAEKRNQPKV